MLTSPRIHCSGTVNYTRVAHPRKKRKRDLATAGNLLEMVMKGIPGATALGSL
jgi:hypothetical protein